MKKILFTSLLVSAALFSACEDDRDSNPVVQQPTTFQLNIPAMSENLYVLDDNTATIRLTYKQPDYGYTAAVDYYTQVSLTNEWTDATSADADNATYIEMEGSTNKCETNINVTELNRNIIKMGKYTNQESIPTEGISLFIRMRAQLKTGYECFSNPIELKVLPYYVALTAADPELWYLIGGCIGDGNWGSEIGISVIPMSPVEGAKYDDTTGQGELNYIGYFPTNGEFKIVKIPGQWGDQWGSANNGDITQPALKTPDFEPGNFKITTEGYYKIVLNTKENTLSITSTDAPKTYEHIFISGDWNGWATDQQMTPVNSGNNNHVWTINLDTPDNATTVKFLYDGWLPNWGAEGFPYGFGVNGGANIPVEAGSYTIIFNDIDGYYHFFSK